MDGRDGRRRAATSTLGEPALLLVESLIHELVAEDVLHHNSAIEVIATARDSQITQCDERGEDVGKSYSLEALLRIQSTLMIDRCETVSEADLSTSEEP